MKKFAFIFALLVLACGPASETLGVIYVVDLPSYGFGSGGSNVYSAWTDLRDTTVNAQEGVTYPAYSAPAIDWPKPIGSQEGTGGGGLNKVANGAGGFGPRPAGSSLHFGTMGATTPNHGGTIGIAIGSPIDDLKHIALQLSMRTTGTGDLVGLPVLYYNDETEGLLPDLYQFAIGDTLGEMFGEQMTNQWHLAQWDLSGVGEEITSFEIQITAVRNGGLYAARVDQSDVWSTFAIPEPSGVTLLGTAMLGFMGLRRSRRKSDFNPPANRAA